MLYKTSVAILFIVLHVCNGYGLGYRTERVDRLPPFENDIRVEQHIGFKLATSYVSAKFSTGAITDDYIGYLQLQLRSSNASFITVEIYNFFNYGKYGFHDYEKTTLTLDPADDESSYIWEIPYFEAGIIARIEGPNDNPLSVFFADVSTNIETVYDKEPLISYEIVTDLYLNLVAETAITLSQVGPGYIQVICLDDLNLMCYYGDILATVVAGDFLYVHELLDTSIADQWKFLHTRLRFLVVPIENNGEYGRDFRFRIYQERIADNNSKLTYVAIACSIVIPAMLLGVTKGCTKFPSSFGAEDSVSLEEIDSDTEHSVPNGIEEVAIPAPIDEVVDMEFIPAAATVDG